MRLNQSQEAALGCKISAVLERGQDKPSRPPAMGLAPRVCSFWVRKNQMRCLLTWPEAANPRKEVVFSILGRKEARGSGPAP